MTQVGHCCSTFFVGISSYFFILFKNCKKLLVVVDIGNVLLYHLTNTDNSPLINTDKKRLPRRSLDCELLAMTKTIKTKNEKRQN
ncbi:MAG: hypothetical protein NTW79_04475 [Candidatus Berkelbacteria bacterium]|nr:hypothetical protein [Candidatus Berkelbacteria bacterium]